jgi:predicted transcriptional regulator
MPEHNRIIHHTPEDLRIMRELLGLSRKQAAELTETTIFQIQKLERPADRESHIKPPRRYAQLLEAYQAGFRPTNWPEDVA